MTPRQIELARHALGLTNGRKETYRTHFCAGPGHVDFEDWMGLVRGGRASVVVGGAMSGGDHVFRLFRDTAEKVLRPGETLDPERWA